MPASTSPLFAVIRTRGPAWNSFLNLEQQPAWDAHAVFMNALKREGLIVLGGPLEDSPDVPLIFSASGPDEIRRRLQADPWTVSDLLRISRISPWTLRLGSLAATSS